MLPKNDAIKAIRYQRDRLNRACTPGSRPCALRSGNGAILRVDCHWRLDESSAAHVIAACAEPGVDWVECPLPETPERLMR